MARIFFLLLLLLLPLETFAFGGRPASAERCAEEAEGSYRQGVHRLLLSFEGLAMPKEGPVFDNLVQPLQQELRSFHAVPFRYTHGEEAFLCVSEWKKVHGDRLALTLVGHSFGGGIALQDLLSYLEGAKISVQHVITLDPRNRSSSVFSCPSAEAGREKFRKPSHVGIYLNFYQCGSGLPGEHVAGGENRRISGFSHISLPRSPLVKSVLRGFLTR